MKKLIIMIIGLFVVLNISACDLIRLGTTAISTPLEDELKTSARIVFTNTKEPTLKFTVADPKVIGQVAGVIGKTRAAAGSVDIVSDYKIVFYFQNGHQKTFNYWMGAAQNNKEINLKDDQGGFYKISESLDNYIVNSTKMWQRPSDFVSLYSTCLTECISRLEKEKSKETVVGVDITSDRRMRRYTMSYEDEKLFDAINPQGYNIAKWSDNGKFTYGVSYVTNVYNPDKARITIDVVKIADKTKETYTADAMIEDGRTWIIKITKNN